MAIEVGESFPLPEFGCLPHIGDLYPFGTFKMAPIFALTTQARKSIFQFWLPLPPAKST